jgi:triphosphoribosyl-dephospho-CoA synthase
VITDARRAYLWACALDVVVRKPGNVSVASPGHGMHAEQFMTSAIVSADALFEPGAPVGKRIDGAIEATRAAVGCNTNLGIVLLCAPLVVGMEWMADHRFPDWRPGMADAIRAALERLTVDDAHHAYRAIALANPGGLGAASQQDVREPPSIDLRAAMQLAADRDRIAAQYANEFADVIEFGLPPFARFPTDPALAMLGAYLAFLASGSDSHIVRKHGAALAHSVTDEARTVLEHWRHSGTPPDTFAVAAWDERLKNAGLNPGTSADLAVAAAFLVGAADPRLCDLAIPGLAWNVLNTRPTLTRLSG